MNSVPKSRFNFERYPLDERRARLSNKRVVDGRVIEARLVSMDYRRASTKSHGAYRLGLSRVSVAGLD